MTDEELLDLPLGENDARAATLREYLKLLLVKLWLEEADFNSKRPFGSSGWEYDVYAALVRAGALPGTFDEDGYLQEVDVVAADALIVRAIGALR